MNSTTLCILYEITFTLLMEAFKNLFIPHLSLTITQKSFFPVNFLSYLDEQIIAIHTTTFLILKENSNF